MHKNMGIPWQVWFALMKVWRRFSGYFVATQLMLTQDEFCSHLKASPIKLSFSFWEQLNFTESDPLWSTGPSAMEQRSKALSSGTMNIAQSYQPQNGTYLGPAFQDGQPSQPSGSEQNHQRPSTTQPSLNVNGGGIVQDRGKLVSAAVDEVEPRRLHQNTIADFTIDGQAGQAHYRQNHPLQQEDREQDPIFRSFGSRNHSPPSRVPTIARMDGRSRRTKRPDYIGLPSLRPTFISPSTAENSASLKGITDNILRKNGYEYTPLPPNEQFRILRLDAASEKEEPLRCELIPAKLTHSYEALSYYWGTGEPEFQIKIRQHQNGPKSLKGLVEGSISGRSFYIRANLDAALRELRDPENPIDLWVDAICINQEDDEEKRVQVARMEEIYSCAQCVLIWLGPSTSSSDAAFQFIVEMCNLRLFDALLAEEYIEKWEALAQLMRNVWFSRRWVVQELALAKEAELHCGSAMVFWDNFADAIAFFTLKFDQIRRLRRRRPLGPKDPDPLREVGRLGPNVLVDATSNLFRRDEDQNIIEHRQTLETLVSNLTAYEASDSRDTIYAMLSIAMDTNRPNSGSFPRALHEINPDYEKDLVEVCRDFVESCFKCSNTLDIICRHWAPIARKFQKLESQDLRKGIDSLEQKNWVTKRKLASWMPSILGGAYGAPQDIQSGRVNGDSLVGIPSRRYYNAAFGKSPEYSFGKTTESPWIAAARAKTKNPRQTSRENSPLHTPSLTREVSNGTISITGLLIDTVKHLGERCDKGTIKAESLKIGGWSQDNAEFLPDELWRTLVADRGREGTSAPHWYKRACGHAIAQRDVTGDVDTRDLIEQDRDSIVVEFLKRVSDVIWNRRFFRTSGSAPQASPQQSPIKTRLGLAPPSAEIGDIVCVLFGCSVPVLLRALENDDGYKFIGECYLHGIMDGEAITVLTRTQLKDKARVFKIH